MKPEPIAIPSYISKLMTMSDKGIRVQVDTQELSSEDKAYLFSLHNKYGHFVFVEGEVKPDGLNIPESVPEFKNEKSQSQRLRSVLFVLWEQNGKPNTSERFYREHMEKIIEHYKDKLV